MKNKIIRWIKWVYIILAIAFLTYYFFQSYHDLKDIDLQVQPKVLILSILFFMLYKILLSLIWHFITIKNKVNISLEKSIISWYYSMLGKYIPGKLFLLGGRLFFYHLEGKPKKTVTFCFFLENLSTLLGAAFLFLLSLLFINDSFFYLYKYAVVLVIVLLFIMIHPRIQEYFFNKVLHVLKKEPIYFTINYWQTLQIVIVSTINWLIVGTGFYLLISSIYPVPIKYFFYVAGSFGLSVIIGILSFFAPSGLGVREGIMIYSLCLIMPESAAIIISIVSRVWTLIPELLMIVLVYIYAKIKRISFHC